METYLWGSAFVIRTDHHSLKYLLEQKVGTTAEHKWISKLLSYEFSIEYEKGVEYIVADALSQRVISDYYVFTYCYIISYTNLVERIEASIS